jgi:hypothetical protein
MPNTNGIIKKTRENWVLIAAFASIIAAAAILQDRQRRFGES